MKIQSTAVHTAQRDFGGCWLESLLGHRSYWLKVFVDFRHCLQLSVVIINSKFVPYLLISCRTVLLEKLIGSQLIAALTRVRQPSLS